MGKLLLALASLALAVPSGAQFCEGDRISNQSLTATDANSPFRINIWSRTRLIHSQSHPSCSGTVKAQSQLFLLGGAFGCQTGLVSANGPMATNGPGNHEKIAQRWCTASFCNDFYQAKGQHYKDSMVFPVTSGNFVTGGDCSYSTCNPCTPGYVDTGECAPSQQDACGCCLDPCPLLVDRTGDGLQLSSAADGVLLDINGLGAVVWLGWPQGPDDAWLAIDRNGNGIIDNGSELFGNTRNLASGVNAKHGYEVLAELDANADGRIDEADPKFTSLLLWGDANRNGVSEPAELVTLRSAGVQSLSLSWEESEERDRWGNRFKFVATDRSSVDVFPVWQMPDSRRPASRPGVRGDEGSRIERPAFPPERR